MARNKLINVKEAIAAFLGGYLGFHRFLLKQPKVAFLFILVFFVAPLVAIYCAIVDGLFLLVTPKDEWLKKTPRTWKTKARRRTCLYGSLLILYLGTPLYPFIPAPTYSIAEGPDFYKSYKLPEVRLPIFYRDEYNIRFFGLEKLHPFDSQKYGRIFKKLSTEGLISPDKTVEPPMLSDEMLLKVHPHSYLNSLRDPWELLKILEIPVVYFIPWQLTQRNVLTPMRFATSGTIMGALAAWQRGWAINLGGGFHHAHAEAGGGFCVYADITLAIRNLREALGRPVKVMILDLDAHQGNGHEHDFLGDKSTFILDAFNPSIYPNDFAVKEAIGDVFLTETGIKDDEYLSRLKAVLKISEGHFQPEFILYNAGTDIMAGDPLGQMKISPAGIIKRDEIVFRWARSRKIPIEMVLSGGYQKSNAPVIAASISNLMKNVLLMK